MESDTPALQYTPVADTMLDQFPELRSAHERLLKDWGIGEPPGQYIILEDLLGKLVSFLLVRESGRVRDELLRRFFKFVELLLKSHDGNLRELAYVGLLEHHADWWYARATDMIGPEAAATLDSGFPEWRKNARRAGPHVPPGALASLLDGDPWEIGPIVDQLLGVSGRGDR